MGRPGLWQTLGYIENPYDARPLRPTPEDADLLAGREEESVAFATILESGPQGVCIISGRPGVGKTSFFNIQQYRSATGLGSYGPRLLTAEQPCTIRPGDSVRAIARRVLEMLIKSVEVECYARGSSVPRETSKIAKWIRQSGGGGYEVGISIAGFGGNFGRSPTLPTFDDASFEALCDAIAAVVSEVVLQLEFGGAFMPLDNLENLDDEQLKDMLISFRDTLFDVPCLWWVLIGQSGLGSLIQTMDPRVWERVSGTGLELKPLPVKKIHEAIQLRVERFGVEGHAVSPLPLEIHEKLYRASQGELRYTLKKSTDICIKAVTNFRKDAEQLYKTAIGKDEEKANEWAEFMAKSLVNGQIPLNIAEDALREIVSEEFEQLNLTIRERRVFKRIADRTEVRPRDYEAVGFNSSQSFYSQFLGKFHSQQLLYRRQEGSPVYYGLRGIALMAIDYGLLDDDGSVGSTSTDVDDFLIGEDD